MARRRTTTRGKDHAVADEVARLSRMLTRERENLPQSYLHDAGLRAAYEVYYLPANIDKVRLPLRELMFPRPGTGTVRVLDLGCGPGSATLGVLRHLENLKGPPRIEVTAVDEVPENLAAMKQHVESWASENGRNVSLRTVSCGIDDVGRRVAGLFDLMLFSNVLNELFAGKEDRVTRRARLVKQLMGMLLDANGSCIIIEPALRETSRDLLLVRDLLVAQGARVHSPCLFSGPCPALANPKDWCHEDIPWSAPQFVQDIDRATGLRKDSLKFSYLVLRNDDRALSDRLTGRIYRVVSEPLVSKGKRELYVCGAGARLRAVRLDKDASNANASFAGLIRGDIVRIEEVVEDDGRLRIGRDVGVVLLTRHGMQCKP